MLPAVGDDHGMVKASEDGTPNAKSMVALIALSANNSGGRFMSQTTSSTATFILLPSFSFPPTYPLRPQT